MTREGELPRRRERPLERVDFSLEAKLEDGRWIDR